MTWPAISLVGLERLMLLMYDDPDGLHRLMAFLRDDHLAFASWLEREGLLSLNQEDDYVGSGSTGYTTTCRRPERAFGRPVRTRDLWVLLESQETVGVGPDLYGEFVFPYQRAIAERFGLVYHGCCEPVHTRWEVVRRMPGLRSVSSRRSATRRRWAPPSAPGTCSRESPTRRSSAPAVRRGADPGRPPPHPAGRPGCPLEIIMKDVHTLDERPERLARWVALAREEIAGTGRGEAHPLAHAAVHPYDARPCPIPPAVRLRPPHALRPAPARYSGCRPRGPVAGGARCARSVRPESGRRAVRARGHHRERRPAPAAGLVARVCGTVPDRALPHTRRDPPTSTPCRPLPPVTSASCCSPLPR